MTSPYSQLIPESRQFFADLAANNTKDWFTENKPRYETQLKKPATQLLADIAPHLAELAGSSVKTKLYRPHRDIRFSKDKTPYSLHLHTLWTPQGSGTQPAYFFGIAKDYVTAGAGLMAFDKQQQSAWRAWVSEREGAALQSRIDAVLSAGGRVGEPELKRVPAPFGADHPQATLLRRKGLTLWMDIETQASTNLKGAILHAFEQLNPVMDDLRAFL